MYMYMYTLSTLAFVFLYTLWCCAYMYDHVYQVVCANLFTFSEGPLEIWVSRRLHFLPLSLLLLFLLLLLPLQPLPLLLVVKEQANLGEQLSPPLCQSL